MNMTSCMRGFVLSLLPLALASGCVLDKQSLGEANDTEGDANETEDSSDEATTGAASLTSSGGPEDTGVADGPCGPNVCGPCAPGCEAMDECNDGTWDCACTCEDTEGGETDDTTGGPRVCMDEPVDVPSQLAYRYADLPSPGGDDGGSDTGGSGGTSTTDGPDVDPDTLFIRLGTEVLACGESPTYACDNWSVSISIPPAYQQPGIYDIDDTEIGLSYSLQGEQQSADPEDCSFGGGGGLGGTLEIFAIDDDTVYGAFCSTDLFEISLDGVFAAQRC